MMLDKSKDFKLVNFNIDSEKFCKVSSGTKPNSSTSIFFYDARSKRFSVKFLSLMLFKQSFFKFLRYLGNFISTSSYGGF